MDRLTGQHLCVYKFCTFILFSFYFMFWASVVGSVACKRVLWNTTVIFTTNKYTKIPDNDFVLVSQPIL